VARKEISVSAPTYNPQQDPTEDANFPRIVAYRPDDDPEWPDYWSSEPTERDEAAIAAQEGK